MEQRKTASLRETILTQINAFLFEEKFSNSQLYLAEGIFDVINMISDYKEEGKALYPEVLVTNDLKILTTISNFKVQIGRTETYPDAFKKIIKTCAPLCNNDWIIYIEAKDNVLTYGLTCAEIVETAPSLYKQTVGDMKIVLENVSVAYVHNLGKKTVELKGLRTSIAVSLSLNDPNEISINEVGSLASHICHSLDNDIKETAKYYFEKILSEGLKESHGNLIAVIENTPEAYEKLKSTIPDGVFLETPIDLTELLKTFESEKSASNSVALRQYSSVVKAMCNNDGIAVFTTDGKLIGYHLMISKDFITEEARKNINGGARTRAFYNIKTSGAFVFVFMQSQDGPIKTFTIYE